MPIVMAKEKAIKHVAREIMSWGFKMICSLQEWFSCFCTTLVVLSFCVSTRMVSVVLAAVHTIS